MKVSIAITLFAVVALSTTFSSQAAECHGKPKPDAKPNLNAVISTPPVFHSSVVNAKMYIHASGTDDELPVVHLWGTPYQMGFAHGSLRNETMQNMINAVWGYLELQVEQAINGTVHNLKPWFVDLVAELGLDGALQATLDATEPYTGKYFGEEIQGMADATGVSAKKIKHIHMIGELTKGDCSMFGAWGNATKTNYGRLLQMRALDWDVDGPFRNYPQLTVYHPVSAEYGHAFANIGWTGWIGSITGFSSAPLAICEIGVAFPDETFGKESRFGVPFTYVLRDILQFDQTIGSAESRLRDAHRTCDLILGVGDFSNEEQPLFRGVQYSASTCNFYTDYDNMPLADWHPRMNNVVYYGMDWLCPGYSIPLHAQLNLHYGNITAANAIRDVMPIVQTGDLHIAVYDLTYGTVYIANARRDGASGPDMAYDRPYVVLNAFQLWQEQPPSF